MADELADKTIEELEQLIASATNGKEQTNLLLEMAKRKEKDSLTAPETFLQQALQVAAAANYPYGEATAYKMWGELQNLRGNFNQALIYFNQALDFFLPREHALEIARTKVSMGNSFAQTGSFSNALEHYYEALAFYEKINNKSGIAGILNNIGLVQSNLSNLEKALELFFKAATINIEINNKNYLLRNYQNIGGAYANLMKYEEALQFFNKMIELCKEMDENYLLAEGYGNLAEVYQRQGNYKLSLKYSYKSLPIAQRNNFEVSIAQNYTRIATSLNECNEPDKALEYLFKAKDFFLANSIHPWIEVTLIAISRSYELQGKWKEALEYYKKGEAAEKSTNKEMAQRTFANLEMQRHIIEEEAERKATLKVLHNILPQTIAERIKTGDEEIIERFDNCSVLFADIVGFTKWSAGLDVKELAKHLNRMFQLFDELSLEYGVEKIKTIGDAYMAVAGLPEPCTDHAERVAKMALGMQLKIKEAYPNGEIKLRIGIHCGEVVAGVLGKNKYAYDLWGDTVNTASRMESHGDPDKIHVTEDFVEALKPYSQHNFIFTERGVIDIKSKGKMKTYFLHAHA
jgi:class 3 adenylate cyclase/lipopolysaccharide biosynthesis regulator YciM